MATTTTTTNATPEANRAPTPRRAVDEAIDQAPHGVAGIVSIAGALAMACGGLVWSSAGADLWGLVDGDVPVDTYLADAAASVSTLHTAHSIWIAGVLVISVGGVLLAGRRDDAASSAARAAYTIAAALAIPAFIIMVALTRLAESGADAPALANTLAFLGARLDDLATAVILGVGPVLLAVANHNTWMPSWLTALAGLSGAAAVLSVVSLFFGLSASLGFVVVPIGVIWTIAAGILAIRRP